MRDVEKWLLDAPHIQAPDNFLERLMDRITRESIMPLPVKPVLPTRNIGYALLASAAAILLIMPFMQEMQQALGGLAESMAGILRGDNLPRFLVPLLGGR